MRCYAQISGGICVAITQAEMAPTPIPGDQIVEIPSPHGYLGRAYTSGAWAPSL